MTLEKYSLKMPKAVYSGTDSLERIPEILAQAHAAKVAAFTDQSLRKLGLFDLVEQQIKASGIAYEIFDDLPAEPTYMAVQKVIDQFKASKCDFVIACGGGSVMDAAKLASVLVTDAYGVKELLDDPRRAGKCVPLLTIPTTAGTGAEVTPNAIVGVPERELKIGIVNDNLISDYVILDARMIRNLPRKIAAATGVDAMCHAIECFTSRKANPFSDSFALDALDIIMNDLADACDHSDAMEAKTKMQIAAFYAGIAITSSGTTAVHALSYPLGGRYHIAHGVSNAILLIPVMRFNEPACRSRMAAAWDRVYHGDRALQSEAEKSAALIDWMAEIVRHLEIPTSLKEFGVDPKDLDSLTEAGMSVTRLLVNNMREVTPADARAIYSEVL
jgi:alcohol dehydrogenase class IV